MQFTGLIVICNELMEFWFSGDESWDILGMLTVVVHSCFERELGTFTLFLPVDVLPRAVNVKGGFVVNIISVPLCPDSTPDDRNDLAAERCTFE